MKVSTRLKISALPIVLRVHKANSIGKKIKKYNDEVKYPVA